MTTVLLTVVTWRCIRIKGILALNSPLTERSGPPCVLDPPCQDCCFCCCCCCYYHAQSPNRLLHRHNPAHSLPTSSQLNPFAQSMLGRTCLRVMAAANVEGPRPIATSMQRKLQQALSPVSLKIINESHKHAGHRCEAAAAAAAAAWHNGGQQHT
jgi:hypothetical protein